MGKNWSYWNTLGGTNYTSDQIAEARRQAEKNVASTWTGIGRDPSAERLPTRWKDADQKEKDELFTATLQRLFGQGSAGAGETPLEAKRRELTGAGRFSDQTSEQLAKMELSTAFADTDPLIGAARQGGAANIGSLSPSSYTSGPVADTSSLDQSRGYSANDRQMALAAIQQLRDIATGKVSAVDAEAQRQREELSKSVSSDIASMPAASEASVRAAMMARASGEADLGARTAVARQQEQQDAMELLMAGTQAQQGADQAQQGYDLQAMQAALTRQAAADNVTQWLYSSGTGSTSATQSAFGGMPSQPYAQPGQMSPWLQAILGGTSGLVTAGAQQLMRA